MSEKGAGGRLFGEFVHERRKALRLTLRQFCIEVGINAGNFSKIERGILSPPKDRETLEKWAATLQIKKDSPEWKELIDLAAISKGRLPDYVMDDKELAQALPWICRTIWGDKITDEQFEKLKNLVRESFSGH